MAAKNNGRDQAAGLDSNFEVRGQFIRDMSFENFRAQRKEWNFVELKHNTKLTLDIDTLPDSSFVVAIKLNLEATASEKPAYLLELEYCGLFRIQGFPQDQLQSCLAVQCPQIIFPFLRRVVADITQDGGFPAHNLGIINFAAHYQRELERQRAVSETKH